MTPERTVSVDWTDIMIASGAPVDFVDFLLGNTNLGHGSLVLEAGCGTGKMGISLSSRTGCTTFLVDNDREVLSRVNRYIFCLTGLFLFPMRAITNLADITVLPYGDGVFDLVFNEGVIEHFEDPMVPIREMVRVARDKVCCMVPHALNTKQLQMAREQMERHKGLGRWEAYEKPMTEPEIIQLFEKAGLVEIRTGFLFPEGPPTLENFRIVAAIGRKS